MKKGWWVLLVFLVLSLIFLVYAQGFSEKEVRDKSIGSLVIDDNLSVGDVFYLSDGKKARVTGVEELVDNDFDTDTSSTFDDMNFFANGVLVHNKAVMADVIAITKQEKAIEQIRSDLLKGRDPRELIQEYRIFKEEGEKQGVVFEFGGTGRGTSETGNAGMFLYTGSRTKVEVEFTCQALDSDPGFFYYLEAKFPELRKMFPLSANPELKEIYDFIDGFLERHKIDPIYGIFEY